MAEQTTLADLGKAMGLAPAPGATAPAKPKLDAKGRAYATGRRKNAISRVWIKRGTGKITVNGKTIETYFARPVLRMVVQQPLVLANRATQFDVDVTVVGGGLSGQAGAVRHGLSRALTYFEPELRGLLKKAGFLTRDSRAVERKKYAAPRPAAASSSRSAKGQQSNLQCGRDFFPAVFMSGLCRSRQGVPRAATTRSADTALHDRQFSRRGHAPGMGAVGDGLSRYRRHDLR